MNPISINNWEIQYKERLLSLFKSFQAFCNDNDLVYYAAYGTMLGAVRHKGIIPWDDDIDVYMPRESYNRLITLISEASNNDFEILSWHSKGYHQVFVKVCDLHSTLCPFPDLSVIMGVFIDIFPLDKMNGPAWLCNYYSAIYRNIIRFYKKNEEGKYGVIARKILSAIEKGFLTGKKTVSSCGPYREREVFTGDIFQDSLDVPFEDFTIKIPAQYDKYLSQLYGEWRKLPPEEKRISNHDIYYINFNSRLERNQIKSDIESSTLEGYVVGQIIESNPYKV